MSLFLKDFESLALTKLDPEFSNHLNRGSQNDVTLKANVEAFKRWRIRPRYLVDVSKRDLTVNLFGQTLRMPVCVSPFGLSRDYHPNGEFETAKGVQQSGTVMAVSVGSTVPLEEIAEAEPELNKWFQLFIYKDRNVTIDMAHRAQRAGYKALVLTVDHPAMSIRPHYLKSNRTRPNYTPYAMSKGNYIAVDNTWDDIRLIKERTQLPLVLKGILTAEDAILAVNAGADAIFVSNHGGRQLDGAPASFEALPEIVEAVGNKVDVYIDGGVRSGNDVFKALAMGAKAVFIGRPICWGLVCDGWEGVKAVLDIFYKELDSVMTLTGCQSIKDINRSHIKLIERYYK